MSLRRATISVIAICISICVSSAASIGSAAALDYPTRPVRWVMGFAPGRRQRHHRAADRRAALGTAGQQFVIENKPGAGGNIGAESVINAVPDGYTVLLVNPSNFINTSLYANLKFYFPRDVAAVASFIRVPNVMTVGKGVVPKTVAEFIAYTKANPGKINMASAGTGTSTHLSGEMFMAMTGVKMQHVPYRGAGPAVTDCSADRCK